MERDRSWDTRENWAGKTSQKSHLRSFANLKVHMTGFYVVLIIPLWHFVHEVGILKRNVGFFFFMLELDSRLGRDGLL